MNFDKQFEKLINAARGDSSPQVDIANRVFAIVSHPANLQNAAAERQFMWFAAISTAAAAMIVAAAIAAYYNWSDPIYEVSEAISWVMQ